MAIFQLHFIKCLTKILNVCRISIKFTLSQGYKSISWISVIEQMKMVGPGSLTICLLTACFVGMVFTLQVAKEFVYLDAVSIIGGILAASFIRELSPVLTSVIIVGRIGSAFTAEIATMKVTEQIDALYVLRTNPLIYLVSPRIIACMTMLPVLNIISLATSLASSTFLCFSLYDISPTIFFTSAFYSLFLLDLFKSSFKTMIFGLLISSISCGWGLIASGGAKGVGLSTTSSVVTSLLSIFIMDFILSYFMFHNLDSVLCMLS